MPVPPPTVTALRQLLDDRFPPNARPAAEALPTGFARLDQRTGGLPRSALTELTCTGPSCGSQLFTGQTLLAVRELNGRAAFVDSSDAFDPASWPADALVHLVWVRGHTLAQALGAAHLLARDANLDLVVLDLRSASGPELRRIPQAMWYRLQRAVKNTAQALLVLTSRPLVPSAQLRLHLEHSHRLAGQERERRELNLSLEIAVQRQRFSTEIAS